ncbi:MAG: nucleoside kinase [Candidatus Choladocola sp.]|nr:nucleoside kinase [Candidatus Choladocola sp.]
MKNNRITVEIKGQKREYSAGITYREIAAQYQEDMMSPIVLVKADGRLRELAKKAEDGCVVEFVTLLDTAGYNTYRRSLVMLMLRAIYHVAGDNNNIDRVGVHFAVGGGYYCTMQGKTELNQQFLDEVKAYMEFLVKEKIPFVKTSVATYEARKRFKKYRMYDKEELFRYRRASKVNIYSLEKFEDYFYGYMLPDTSLLTQFDLKLFEDGFVLRFPAFGHPEELPPFKPDMKIFHVQKDSMEWGKKLEIPTVGALNSYIVNHQVKDLIMIQEAYHEKKIAEMAAQIAASPEKKIVLIAGPSSSGKTTFSHRLSTQLSVYGLRPHPIAADNYFVNREFTPLDEDGKPDFERLEAIDIDQLNQDMLDLLDGKTVDLPAFNFKTGKREYKGNRKTLGKDDILIIEGIHCLNDQLTCRLPRERKFKIYISALTQLNIDEHNRIPTTDGRLLRRIVRDARTRGSDAGKTIAMWPSVRRGEENNIFPYQEEADVMFNSALIYELAVLKQYAEPLLFSVLPESPEFEEAKRLLKFLDYFLPIPGDNIPNNSLIREFIGGGCFDL